MKRTCMLLAAGLVGVAASAQTQTGVPPGLPPSLATALQQARQSLLDQQAQTLDAGGRGVLIRPLGQLAEIGKPYSATVTTQTSQTYLDGTHVTHTSTVLQYRDAEGRTRMETEATGRGGSEPVRRVVIRDFVAGVSYNLDLASKTAIKLGMAGIPGIPVGPAAGGGRGARGGRGGADNAADISKRDPNNLVEDLGTMTVNGVTARGTRITTVVPAGAIGNDRDFRSVDERWFSPDLNLLIKSVTNDPRFGTTVYEMTNISRMPPDPTLFAVPPDYKIVSNNPREPQF